MDTSLIDEVVTTFLGASSLALVGTVVQSLLEPNG